MYLGWVIDLALISICMTFIMQDDIPCRSSLANQEYVQSLPLAQDQMLMHSI